MFPLCVDKARICGVCCHVSSKPLVFSPVPWKIWKLKMEPNWRAADSFLPARFQACWLVKLVAKVWLDSIPVHTFWWLISNRAMMHSSQTECRKWLTLISRTAMETYWSFIHSSSCSGLWTGHHGQVSSSSQGTHHSLTPSDNAS